MKVCGIANNEWISYKVSDFGKDIVKNLHTLQSIITLNT